MIANAKTAILHNTALRVFGLLWLVLFVLYVPTSAAGWVTDTVDWQLRVRTSKFWDYINITQTRVPSLYQFTQLTTYLLYQLLGANHRLWFLLELSMQAANGTLLYVICKKLFNESGVAHGPAIAFGGALLFCICPHISEVLVWKACFHYIQGLLMLLAIVYWVQRYHHTGSLRYAWWSAVVFFLSSFSIEYFYLTPWFALTLTLYYRLVLGRGPVVFRRAMLYYVLPLFILFAIHLVTLRVVTGFYYAHLGNDAIQPWANYLRKAPIHLFHNLFLGRFFSDAVRRPVYDFFVTTRGLAFFYGFFAFAGLAVIYFIKAIKPPGKAAILIFIWLVLCAAIVCPVWIPDIQLVAYDRYAYFMLPFIYLLLAMGLARLPKTAALVLFVGYAAVNIYYTHKVNVYWRQSAQVVYKLSHNLPDVGNKTVLLLNVPANMNGVPMIGSLPQSAFKLLYEVENNHPLPNPVYDVVSYNLVGASDGAHVTVLNDSMAHITLNQWGNWWWYATQGATSYQNAAYKVNMIDAGHWYELTLKGPASGYCLLYQVGDTWKVVDWEKKNVDQY